MIRYEVIRYDREYRCGEVIGKFIHFDTVREDDRRGNEL